MSTLPNRPPLAPPLAALLADLRRRIRRYVWLEGTALTAAWLGLACWLTLVGDWFFEPSPLVRVWVLLLVGLVALGIVVQWIARRAVRPLTDANLALLLERRYPQFDETLLTAVELGGRPADDHAPELLAATAAVAAERARGVSPAGVLNPRPLRRSALAAVTLVGAFLILAAIAPAVLATWSRRVLLLSRDEWPRRTELFVEGFPNGVAKVARGADLELTVKAATAKVVPQVVHVRWRSGEGREQTAPMSRLGQADPAREQFQSYTHTFEGVLAPIRFDVRGGDDAIRDLRIEVVESPTIVEMALLCQYPGYMNTPPRRMRVEGPMSVPQGATVTVECRANKPLVEVHAEDAEARTSGGPSGRLTFARPVRRFQVPLGQIEGEMTRLFTLWDADGIRSREPVRLALAAVPDQPPELAVKLQGIGAAVTPRARIPAGGRVTDDYGVARVWFEWAVDEGQPAERPIPSPRGYPTDFAVAPWLEAADLNLATGKKLRLAIKAADYCDLAGRPHVGSTEQWLLDVVTPEQLRSMLEARELVLRQRFEAVVQEAAESRDQLLRLGFGKPGPQAPPAASRSTTALQAEGPPLREPGDPGPAETPSPAQEAALRAMRVERVAQNSQKNAEECLGLAESFDDIRLQLVNNRVDTAELIERLEEGIAKPLRRIAEERFPELELRLARLERTLDDPAAATQSRDLARRQLDAILVEMRQVLDQMIKMEDFNAAVEMLRTIIQRQEQLEEQIKARQKEKLRDLLE